MGIQAGGIHLEAASAEETPMVKSLGLEEHPWGQGGHSQHPWGWGRHSQHPWGWECYPNTAQLAQHSPSLGGGWGWGGTSASPAQQWYPSTHPAVGASPSLREA